MLNYKEIESIKQLKKTVDVDDKHCKIPLFHGTRRYALQVSDAERERFSAACKQVLSFANKLFYSGKVDFNKLNEYYHSSGNHYFLNTVVNQYDSALYEYGAFFLTTSYENAIGFAHQSGGEAGAWAYAQLQGFEDWNIELDDSMKAAAEVIKQEYKKYQNSEKVILIYYGVSFEDLCTERGESFLHMTGDDKNDEEWARMMIENLYDSFSLSYNFRLLNAHAYTAYLLLEHLFREGVVLFENETDVDSFIKRHNLYAVEKWSF